MNKFQLPCRRARCRKSRCLPDSRNGLRAFQEPDARRSRSRNPWRMLLYCSNDFDSDPNLSLDSHRAEGGAQMKEWALPLFARFWNRHGEYRPYLSEGGRTNRGAPRQMGEMLSCLEKTGFSAASKTERDDILTTLQSFLVEKIKEHHNRQRLRLDFDPSNSAGDRFTIFLRPPANRARMGCRAIPGWSKLEMRFPGVAIDNSPASAADEQTGRRGDLLSATHGFMSRLRQSRAL